MVVIESKYPKGADFKLWKIGPKLEDHAKFSAKKLIRQRSFASKAEHYSQHFSPVAAACARFVNCLIVQIGKTP